MVSPFTVYLAEHLSDFKRLGTELGRREGKLRLAAGFWTLSLEEKERLARLSEDPGGFEILSEALEDINGLNDEEELQISESSIAGIVVRTDYSDDTAWRNFVETLLQAERELAIPVDEEVSVPVDFSKPVPNLDEEEDDGSESESDEEMDSPGPSTSKTSSVFPPTSLFALLSPSASSPLRVRLMGASNLTVLRLVNEVDVVRAPRAPPGVQEVISVPSKHRLFDLHGFVEAYSGALVWVYDTRSNTDGAARAVVQSADGVGSATADSWRARASFIPELQLNLVSGAMKIDFGGLDRWDHAERQRNMAEADGSTP